MTPPSLTPPVKPKPAKPVSPAPAQTGVVASPTAAPAAPHDGGIYGKGKDHAPGINVNSPPVLDESGAYSFIYTINPQETRRLLTRTGRGTREEMEKELPRYVERIVKRAVESEIY